MSYTFDQIREFVVLMQAQQGPIFAKMRDILIRYDGDWVLPVPDLSNEPKMPMLTPNLIGEAIDSVAMRAATQKPRIVSPPIDFGKTEGVRSRAYGDIRSSILAATWEASRWDLLKRRWFRHLTAYATSAVLVMPDVKQGMPRLKVCDPLGTYVQPRANEDLTDPDYIAVVKRFPGAEVRQRWTAACDEHGGPVTKRSLDKLWEVVEWYDAEEVVWGLIGPIEQWGDHIVPEYARAVGSPSMELLRMPNRAGMVPAVAPQNVSLGKSGSRIGAMLGNVDYQNKLMALALAAQEKAVFPDTYVLGRMGMEPQMIDGEWKDGRTGDVNRLMDTETIGVLRTTPDPTTGQMIDRLERNFRTSTNFVPQFGGETYGALRTGRGIDAMSSIALDPRIQELHEIAEAYLSTMNKAILATYKGYWGSKQYSMYRGRGNSQRLVEFVPNTHIETLENSVRYTIAGADAMQLTQILGSLYGAKAISRRTFRDGHPYIDNADEEDTLVREEELAEALMQTVMQQVQTGAMPPVVITMLRKQLLAGHDIFRAVELVDEELSRRQATPAPAPEEGMVGAPEAMPGMAGGPAMAQQPGPPEAQVNVPQGAARMRQLMQVMGG